MSFCLSTFSVLRTGLISYHWVQQNDQTGINFFNAQRKALYSVFKNNICNENIHVHVPILFLFLISPVNIFFLTCKCPC